MFLTKMRLKRLYGMLALGLLVALAPAAIANAVCNPSAQSCSSSYQVTESFFGNGGGYSCSTQYCANQSSGELTVGKTGSTNYQAQTGFNTDRIPSIEFIINTPSVDVGVLTSTSTHVGTASFSIKTYLANGYQVTTAANPPSNGGHALATNGAANASTVGVEQFGLNLVANSCPGTAPSSGAGSCSGSLGLNAGCNPSGFCNLATNVTVGANYGTANQYYYPASGADTLLTSTSSTGETDFTMSYIFNISNVTPAGIYTMNQSLVATSTF